MMALCIWFPIPVPFSAWVTSDARYWAILAKRRSYGLHRSGDEKGIYDMHWALVEMALTLLAAPMLVASRRRTGKVLWYFLTILGTYLGLVIGGAIAMATAPRDEGMNELASLIGITTLASCFTWGTRNQPEHPI